MNWNNHKNVQFTLHAALHLQFGQLDWSMSQQKKLSSEEHKTVEESWSSLDSRHF